MIGRGFVPSRHASDQMRLRSVWNHEVIGALGAGLLDAASLTSRPAKQGLIAAVGSPLHLGFQPPCLGSGRREVVLGRTGLGRSLVFVVAIERDRTTLVTVWDPSENPEWWRRDLLRSTNLGDRQLPPTYWLVDGRWGATYRYVHR